MRFNSCHHPCTRGLKRSSLETRAPLIDAPRPRAPCGRRRESRAFLPSASCFCHRRPAVTAAAICAATAAASGPASTPTPSTLPPSLSSGPPSAPWPAWHRQRRAAPGHRSPSPCPVPTEWWCARVPRSAAALPTLPLCARANAAHDADMMAWAHGTLAPRQPGRGCVKNYAIRKGPRQKKAMPDGGPWVSRSPRARHVQRPYRSYCKEYSVLVVE